MQVYNFKVNKNMLFKLTLVVCALICVAIFSYSAYSLVNEMKKSDQNNFTVNDPYFEDENVTTIPSSQYTNVLKEVHDNIDDYIGQKIKFEGYVYRLYDFSDDQFVLARNMIINSASQSVVVGFLCESDKINEFENLSWVKVTGVIEKGELNGEIPVLKVKEIKSA